MEINRWDWGLLVATLLALLYYYFWRKTKYFEVRKIKHLERYPLVGNVLRSVLHLEHIQDFAERVYKGFPKERYVGYFNFTAPTVLIKDPELVRSIMVKDFDHFTDHIDFGLDENVDPITPKMLFMLKDYLRLPLDAAHVPYTATCALKNVAIIGTEGKSVSRSLVQLDQQHCIRLRPLMPIALVRCFVGGLMESHGMSSDAVRWLDQLDLAVLDTIRERRRIF